MVAAVILCIIFLAIILRARYENRSFEVTHYRAGSGKIPEAFSGTKLLVLADLHNNSFGKGNRRLIEEIHRIRPDYVLVAGDMIIGKKANDYSAALSLLTGLAMRYPVFYGYGNHEQHVMPGNDNYDGGFDAFKASLEALGVCFLENKQIRISHKDAALVITGLLIDKQYFNKIRRPSFSTASIQHLVGIADRQCYNILIAHNPVYFSNYTEWGADLTISGHIHGGIIRLPALGGVISPQYKFFPKYDAGKFVKNGSIMLVSRGLGLHTIKLRLFNRPELMVVTLERNL